MHVCGAELCAACGDPLSSSCRTAMTGACEATGFLLNFCLPCTADQFDPECLGGAFLYIFKCPAGSELAADALSTELESTIE